jgi:hypothetical protein
MDMYSLLLNAYISKDDNEIKICVYTCEERALHWVIDHI